MERNPMIIISLDAVGSRDLEYLKSLPHFGKLYERAAVCEKVNSVYPSLTYPAHTSIVTGCFPGRHGIVNNLQIQPERSSPDWFWQRKYVKCTTLYDQAEKAGISVAALLWPVTGKAGIHYNLPEVLPNRPWQNQIQVCVSNGTPLYELALQRRFGHLRAGTRQPQLDNFVQASLLYTLERHRPGLTLAHFTDVDTNRHIYGVDSPRVYEALERHDKRLGEITALLDRQGILEKTNLVVLGDHCQMDVHTAVYPNHLLWKRGYFKVKNGCASDWTAIARDCDGSCYVYVKEERLKAEVGELLKTEAAREDGGIKTVFHAEEAAGMGADPECAFMLEAKPGYYFQNGWREPSRAVEKRCGKQDGNRDAEAPWQTATHGYLPDQPDYHTIFAAAGPAFKAKAAVETMSLVDEGPTLARVLGLELGNTDGRVIKELLNC